MMRSANEVDPDELVGDEVRVTEFALDGATYLSISIPQATGGPHTRSDASRVRSGGGAALWPIERADRRAT